MEKRKFSPVSLLLFFAVIALMAMIFLLSAQTAEESSRLSSGIVQNFLSLFAGYRNMEPQAQQKLFKFLAHAIRKAAHFTEYAFLGLTLLLYLHNLGVRQGKQWQKLLLITALIGIGYAVTDEIHQLFVNGRGGSALDVLIDSSGLITGSFIGKLLLKKHDK